MKYACSVFLSAAGCKTQKLTLKLEKITKYIRHHPERHMNVRTKQSQSLVAEKFQSKPSCGSTSWPTVPTLVLKLPCLTVCFCPWNYKCMYVNIPWKFIYYFLIFQIEKCIFFCDFMSQVYKPQWKVHRMQSASVTKVSQVMAIMISLLDMQAFARSND